MVTSTLGSVPARPQLHLSIMDPAGRRRNGGAAPARRGAGCAYLREAIMSWVRTVSLPISEVMSPCEHDH